MNCNKLTLVVNKIKLKVNFRNKLNIIKSEMNYNKINCLIHFQGRIKNVF